MTREDSGPLRSQHVYLELGRSGCWVVVAGSLMAGELEPAAPCAELILIVLWRCGRSGFRSSRNAVC